MPLYLIAAPDPDDVLTVADAKLHMRVDFEDDDDLIESYIATAIQNIDGRDGWLGRALVAQSWELRLSEFSGSVIPIPLPPLIAITHIKYYDTSNVLQTLSTDVYEVTGVGGFGKARVHLKDGQQWPQTAKRAEPITITFSAGYDPVPAPILTAIKRQVAAMYENREAVVVNASVSKLPGGVEAMLTPYRVWA